MSHKSGDLLNAELFLPRRGKQLRIGHLQLFDNLNFAKLRLLFFGGEYLNHSRDTAILLVTFGTNVTQAATSFKNLEDKVKETFPNIEVRWAYTAKSIRQRLGKMGFHYDSPVTALARLQDEGYTRVAVQSVHMIAGQEYYDLVNVVENMSHLRGISGHNFHPKLANLALKN
ncbi:hypothetical protein N752_16785 [Desulforamulus aquiferis]|nr:hypothetical protein N752_16785 [Desulforamulus aquiferis]